MNSQNKVVIDTWLKSDSRICTELQSHFTHTTWKSCSLDLVRIIILHSNCKNEVTDLQKIDTIIMMIMLLLSAVTPLTCQIDTYKPLFNKLIYVTCELNLWPHPSTMHLKGLFPPWLRTWRSSQEREQDARSNTLQPIHRQTNVSLSDCVLTCFTF